MPTHELLNREYPGVTIHKSLQACALDVEQSRNSRRKQTTNFIYANNPCGDDLLCEV